MMRKSKILSRLIAAIPGQRIFGAYRFMPFFYICGAALEFSMIHWKPKGVNFYHTYKRNQSEKEAVRRLNFEEFKEKVSMPAGVTWGTYSKFVAAALLSMFAGAQTVHYIYKPLEDFDDIVEGKKAVIKKSRETTEAESDT